MLDFTYFELLRVLIFDALTVLSVTAKEKRWGGKLAVRVSLSESGGGLGLRRLLIGAIPVYN